jgi:hypothetical protein
MVDRRVFMKGSVGLAAALAASARAASRPGETPRSDEVIVVDRELEGGDSFAAEARARGLVPCEFSSDVASVWMRELEPRLCIGPTTIRGYTSAATLFCLELLGRDYGARVVLRTERADGVVFILSSQPLRHAALAPLPASRSRKHA